MANPLSHLNEPPIRGETAPKAASQSSASAPNPELSALQQGLGITRLANSTGIAGSATSTVSEVASAIAIPLTAYNFAKNWRSGSTGSDALAGAALGASIGSAFPVIGTAVGAVAGLAVGAVSSIFGGGKNDAETIGWNQYAAAYDTHGPAGVAGANPSQNFQALAGIFDARHSTIPFYGKYGRMGESAFTTDMMTTVNQAIAKGTVAPNATPQQIYSQVVQPWITSMSPNGWQEANTVQGSPTKDAVGNILTTMIGQYQHGQLTSQTPVGIKGQNIPTLPGYASMGTGPSPDMKANAATTVATASAPLTSAITSFPTGSTSTGGAASMLALMLAIPGLAGGAMAGNSTQTGGINPTDPSGGGGGGGTGGGAGGSGTDPSFLTTLSNDISSFVGSPVGALAEFGTLAGLGVSQAGSQQKQNESQAASISNLGAPYSAAGAAELGQITGGPAVGGPMGTTIATVTTAAQEQADVAAQYSTGKLTAAQNQQVKDFVSQQRAMVDTQLAASGNTDSSARDAAYQQIDTASAKLTQDLTQGNIQIGASALSTVTNTYNALLNQALSSSEFGLGAQETAVQTLIQGNTQIAASLNTLFGNIAQGFGSAMSGTGKGSGSGGGAGGAGSVTKAVSDVAKGVAGSASGGGSGTASDMSGPGGTYTGGALSGGAPLYDASTGGYPGGTAGSTGTPDWLSTPTDPSMFDATTAGTGTLNDIYSTPFSTATDVSAYTIYG